MFRWTEKESKKEKKIFKKAKRKVRSESVKSPLVISIQQMLSVELNLY